MPAPMEPEDEGMDFQELQNELHDACMNGNIARINQLFADESLGPTDATDAPCFFEAYPITTIRCLLELGADANKVAAWRAPDGQIRSLEEMKLLVEFGYDVQSNGHLILQDFTTLPEVLDWMLDQGADITRSDDTRASAFGRHHRGGGYDYSLKVLNRVAIEGNIELFDHLVSRGADPSRSRALHCTAQCKDPVKARAMIDHLLDRYQFSIEADNREFLKTGPRPDHGTPLICAIYHKNIAVVRHLLQRGADPETGLWNAVGSNILPREGWIDGLNALLDAGANVDHAFRLAVNRAKIEAASACLDRGTVSSSVIDKSRNEDLRASSEREDEARAKMRDFLLQYQ